jgi:hypothetical protein
VNVLLITYKLNNRLKDYSPLFAAVKANSIAWWHYLDTTWIVTTGHSAHSYANMLYPHIEETDRLLIIKVEKDYQGWLTEDAWAWLNNKEF